jgi:hypothetical protein
MKTRIIIELDPLTRGILDRLRGDMNPSAFVQLLLKMVNSGAVGAPPKSVKMKKRKKAPKLEES